MSINCKTPASFLVYVLAGTMFINSCANSSDGRKTQSQGALLGAGVGSVLGMVTGNQFGGRGGTGSLVGLGIGTVGGFAYGSHVAHQKNKYKTTEAWLDACIADAEKKQQKALAYNRTLDQRIQSLKNEIRAAKASQQKARLAALQKEIAAEEAKAAKQEEELKKEIQLQARVANETTDSSKNSTLRAKSQSLEATRKVTGQRRQVLAQMRNSTGV